MRISVAASFTDGCRGSTGADAKRWSVIPQSAAQNGQLRLHVSERAGHERPPGGVPRRAATGLDVANRKANAKSLRQRAVSSDQLAQRDSRHCAGPRVRRLHPQRLPSLFQQGNHRPDRRRRCIDARRDRAPRRGSPGNAGLAKGSLSEPPRPHLCPFVLFASILLTSAPIIGSIRGKGGPCGGWEKSPES
jgi:hypothetical protein